MFSRLTCLQCFFSQIHTCKKLHTPNVMQAVYDYINAYFPIQRQSRLGKYLQPVCETVKPILQNVHSPIQSRSHQGKNSQPKCETVRPNLQNPYFVIESLSHLGKNSHLLCENETQSTNKHTYQYRGDHTRGNVHTRGMRNCQTQSIKSNAMSF